MHPCMATRFAGADFQSNNLQAVATEDSVREDSVG